MKRRIAQIAQVCVGDLDDDRLIWHRDATAEEVPDISGAGLVAKMPAKVKDAKAPGVYDVAQLNKAFPILGAQNIALQLWGIHATPANSPNDLTGTIVVSTWPRRIRNNSGRPRGRYGLEIDFKIGTEGLVALTAINPIDASVMAATDVRSAQKFAITNGTDDGARPLPYDLYDADETDGQSLLIFDPLKAEYCYVWFKTKGANLGRILVSLQHMGG